MAALIRAKSDSYFGANRSFVLKTVASSEQASGLPDLIACWRGAFIGIEVKISDNKSPRSVSFDSVRLTVKQRYRLQALANAEGKAYAAVYVWQTDEWIVWQIHPTPSNVECLLVGKVTELLDVLFS